MRRWMVEESCSTGFFMMWSECWGQRHSSTPNGSRGNNVTLQILLRIKKKNQAQVCRLLRMHLELYNESRLTPLCYQNASFLVKRLSVHLCFKMIRKWNFPSHCFDVRQSIVSYFRRQVDQDQVYLQYPSAYNISVPHSFPEESLSQVHLFTIPSETMPLNESSVSCATWLALLLLTPQLGQLGPTGIFSMSAYLC